jgi:hypothetical protein
MNAQERGSPLLHDTTSAAMAKSAVIAALVIGL